MVQRRPRRHLTVSATAPTAVTDATRAARSLRSPPRRAAPSTVRSRPTGLDDALTHRVDEQTARRRRGLRAPRRGVEPRRLGREVEQRDRDVDAGDPVDQRVVRLHARARRDRPRDPRRTRAPTADGRGRAAGPAAARTRRAAARAYPAGGSAVSRTWYAMSKRSSSTQTGARRVERHGHDALAEPRDEVQPRRDERARHPRGGTGRARREQRPTLEHGQRAGVHRRLEPLELQEARVERAETVVGAHARQVTAGASLVGRVDRRRRRDRAAGTPSAAASTCARSDEARRADRDGLRERGARRRRSDSREELGLDDELVDVASHSSTRDVEALGRLRGRAAPRARDVRCATMRLIARAAPARRRAAGSAARTRGGRPTRTTGSARRVNSCARRDDPRRIRTQSGHRQRSEQRRERKCPAPHGPIPLASRRRTVAAGTEVPGSLVTVLADYADHERAIGLDWYDTDPNLRLLLDRLPRRIPSDRAFAEEHVGRYGVLCAAGRWPPGPRSPTSTARSCSATTGGGSRSTRSSTTRRGSRARPTSSGPVSPASRPTPDARCRRW